MDVVPVLDLLGGEVVHARGGDRANYRPIVTPLAQGSDPVAVATGLMALAPFGCLYVADLDAIQGRPGNEAALRRLKASFPGLAFWIDEGAADAEAVARRLDSGLGEPVIGSESQRDGTLIERYRDDARVALSLDFRGDDFLGPRVLLEGPQLWPRRVIAMTLARVGAGQGPDVALLERLAAQGARALYAAGGVRDAADLDAAARAGAQGALVATALHDGRIDAAVLARLGMGGKKSRSD